MAEYRGSEYDVAVHARAARNVGLSLDEIDLARRFVSRDEKEQALLRYLESLLENRGSVPIHLHEEAREQGWTRRADPRGARRTWRSRTSRRW